MKIVTPVHKFAKIKHSPTETIDWMYDTYKKADERFKEFYAVLDERKPIPKAYTSPLTADGLGCNRTLRFFRLESLVDAVAAIRHLVKSGKTGQKKLEKLITKVIVPFEENWATLINKLELYYGNKNTTSALITKFENLRYTSKVFQGDGESLLAIATKECPNRNLDIYEELLLDAYKDFTSEFAKLPLHTPKPQTTHPKLVPGLAFDPSCDEYYANMLAYTWGGHSRYENETIDVYSPSSSTKILYHLHICGSKYTVSDSSGGQSFAFNIPSAEARAFIDLLIDSQRKAFKNKGGILKPLVTAKSGSAKGSKASYDFRLAKFKTKGSIKNGKKILGSDDFWSWLIVPQHPGKKDRRVTLGENPKYFKITHSGTKT